MLSQSGLGESFIIFSLLVGTLDLSCITYSHPNLELTQMNFNQLIPQDNLNRVSGNV
jgi:hypothetical protein